MSEATIASLVRQATKTEADFYRVTNELLAIGDTARLAEFFDKMNIPRSADGQDDFDLTEHPIEGSVNAVEDYPAEIAVSQGIQKFIERHLRKLKWHTTHPSMAGISNATRLYRAMTTATSSWGMSESKCPHTCAHTHVCNKNNHVYFCKCSWDTCI